MLKKRWAVKLSCLARRWKQNRFFSARQQQLSGEERPPRQSCATEADDMMEPTHSSDQPPKKNKQKEPETVHNVEAIVMLILLKTHLSYHRPLHPPLLLWTRLRRQEMEKLDIIRAGFHVGYNKTQRERMSHCREGKRTEFYVVLWLDENFQADTTGRCSDNLKEAERFVSAS